MVSRGLFITFEGGDGAGKSTQARRLADRLRAAGREPVLTREPGGTPGGEAVRALLVTGAVDRWRARSEALLLNAARYEHWTGVIAPALADGRDVICDRYADSTRAYQGAGGGLDRASIDALHAWTFAAEPAQAWPDLTVILDVDPDLAFSRAETRNAALGDGEARFEGRGAEFQHALRVEFLAIAAAEPTRCRLVRARGSLDVVEEEVWRVIAPSLDARAHG